MTQITIDIDDKTDLKIIKLKKDYDLKTKPKTVVWALKKFFKIKGV